MHSEAEQKSAESGVLEFIRIRYLSRKGRSEVMPLLSCCQWILVGKM